MAPIDMPASVLAARAQPGAATAQGPQAPAQAAPPGQTAAAAPPYSARAVTQSATGEGIGLRRESAHQGDSSMMLHAQSLAMAVQEEMRLQQKLADLRETIEATETKLHNMQQEAVVKTTPKGA